MKVENEGALLISTSEGIAVVGTGVSSFFFFGTSRAWSGALLFELLFHFHGNTSFFALLYNTNIPDDFYSSSAAAFGDSIEATWPRSNSASKPFTCTSTH